jgi:hypothetical protein
LLPHFVAQKDAKKRLKSIGGPKKQLAAAETSAHEKAYGKSEVSRDQAATQARSWMDHEEKKP